MLRFSTVHLVPKFEKIYLLINLLFFQNLLVEVQDRQSTNVKSLDPNYNNISSISFANSTTIQINFWTFIGVLENGFYRNVKIRPLSTPTLCPLHNLSRAHTYYDCNLSIHITLILTSICVLQQTYKLNIRVRTLAEKICRRFNSLDNFSLHAKQFFRKDDRNPTCEPAALK